MVEYQEIIVEVDLDDKDVKNSIHRIWKSNTANIYIEPYPEADWERLNDVSPQIVCQLFRMKAGEFHTLLAFTFINPAKSGMKLYQIAEVYHEMFDCKVLIGYADISQSHYVLVTGKNDYQHVYADMNYLENSDEQEYYILRYGGKVKRNEYQYIS